MARFALRLRIGVRAIAPCALATALTLSALPARAADCGDLLIILDRSGSMAQCTIDGKKKEEHAKDALKLITDAYKSIPMGLMVFPDTLTVTGGSCEPAKTVVDIAPDGAMKIDAFLTTMPVSRGGTPTTTAVELARDYPDAKWTPGKTHYVLLLTDGQPTCQDGENPADGDAGSMTTMCDGKGCQECKKPFKVTDAVKALAAKGIKTFVVGFGGMGTGCMSSCNPSGIPFRPDTLDEWAIEGGVPNDMGMEKFYSATSGATLRDALMRILGKVSGGTIGGCTTGGGGAGGSGSGGAAGGGAGGSGSGGASGAGGSGQGGDNGGMGGAGQHPTMDPSCVCTAGPLPLATALPILFGFISACGLFVSLRRRR